MKVTTRDTFLLQPGTGFSHDPMKIIFSQTQKRLVIATAVAGAAFLIWSLSSWAPLPTLGVSDPSAATTSTNGVVPPHVFEYLEVVDGCGPYYDTGVCVNMRSGPSETSPVVARLRTGVVLRVEKEISANGRVWDKIGFDNTVTYPDRLPADTYVAAEFVRNFYDDGNHVLTKDSPATTKRIVVDISEQMLYAYDGDKLFMQEPVSTGLELTPTTRGTFKIFKMTPARYMQGPIPGVSDQVYDLPGVPWDMYFTASGEVIHGAYWHDHFGQPYSHGCVNLPPQKAKQLYEWAVIGTSVTIQN